MLQIRLQKQCRWFELWIITVLLQWVCWLLTLIIPYKCESVIEVCQLALLSCRVFLEWCSNKEGLYNGYYYEWIIPNPKPKLFSDYHVPSLVEEHNTNNPYHTITWYGLLMKIKRVKIESIHFNIQNTMPKNSLFTVSSSLWNRPNLYAKTRCMNLQANKNETCWKMMAPFIVDLLGHKKALWRPVSEEYVSEQRGAFLDRQVKTGKGSEA